MFKHPVDEAIALLLDEDLDLAEAWPALRPALADLLDDVWHHPGAVAIVSTLLDKQGEQHEPDPLDQWVYEAARQLGVIDEAVQRSQSLGRALKRLFSAL